MGIPEGLRPLLEGLEVLLRERFERRLESLYLLGSLVHGGWSARLSDVDACAVLADPLEDGDGPQLVAVSGEAAERFPRFGPRLSLFWATPAILRGEVPGGRLGVIDAADLVQNGMLLAGEDVRGSVKQHSREELLTAMYADMSDRWRSRMTPFAGREALEAGRGAELDERTLLKGCLYPVRFLYTAETGRVVGYDEAAQAFAGRHGEPYAGAMRLACAIRSRAAGPEATAEEKALLAAVFAPLYALFFAEIARQYGLEPPRG